MKDLPPIIPELEEHTAVIIGMLSDTQAVLDEYTPTSLTFCRFRPRHPAT